MRLRPAFPRAVLAALLVTAGGNALSLPGRQMLGRYDFGYATEGDRAARPVQVFSDGAGNVYFQVQPGEPMPAIFAGKSLELLLPQARGPYVVVHSAAPEFTLALGGARARVVHGGLAPMPAARRAPADAPGRAAEALPPPLPAAPAGGTSEEEIDSSPAAATRGSTSPDSAVAPLARAIDDGRQLASVAPGLGAAPWHWSQPERQHDEPVLFPVGSATMTPEARAAIDALVARLGAQDIVTLEGRGDVSLHDGLATARVAALRSALLARGVDAARLRDRAAADLSEAVPGASQAPARRTGAVIRWTTSGAVRTLDAAAAALGAVPLAAPVFEIQRTDRDIAASVRRWGERAGYDVQWDTPVSAPVTGSLRLDAGSFLEAVGQVVAGLQAQGYPICAQAVGEHVVRFVAVR